MQQKQILDLIKHGNRNRLRRDEEVEIKVKTERSRRERRGEEKGVREKSSKRKIIKKNGNKE